MEVILLQDVPKVGQRYQAVTVSEGYAINFLIPRGLAKAATASAKKELEMKKAKLAHGMKAQESKIAEGIASVDGKTVTVRRKANDEGHLFAGLHADAISTAVYDQLGACLPEALFDIDHIKALGTYEIPLTSKGKKGTLTLLVERED